MNACPNCGAILGEDAKFCGICSTTISENHIVEPSESVAIAKRICPRCDLEVEANAKYCKNCQMSFQKGDAFAWKGSVLGGGGAAEDISTKKPFIIAAAVLIGATITIVMGIVYLGWTSATPRAVLKQAYEAVESGDGEALMKLQWRKAREAIKPNDEEPKEYLDRVAEVSKEIKSLGGVKSIEIAEEDIKNDEKATLTYTIIYGNGEKKSNRVRMLKENGKWKFAYWPLASPSAVTREILTAMDRGDGETMSKFLGKDLLAQYAYTYGKQGVRDAVNQKYAYVGELFKANGGLTSVEITREQEGEDEAAVDYLIKFGNGETRDRQIWLVKEKGLWKVYSVPDHGLKANQVFQPY